LISNFKGRSYVGDFDEEGNLYTYINGTYPKLSYIDVRASEPISLLQELTLHNQSNIPGVADITYNPVQKRFFGLSGGHELVFLDRKSGTYGIVGDFSDFIDVSGGFGAAWSDQDGNSYFSNNKTGKIFRFTLNQDGAVAEVKYVVPVRNRFFLL
jgi:hypothetical protein